MAFSDAGDPGQTQDLLAPLDIDVITHSEARQGWNLNHIYSVAVLEVVSYRRHGEWEH